MPTVVRFAKSKAPPPALTFIPSMSTWFMLTLPPRVEMVVVPPRLPDWMTVNPGTLRRIWSMSVTCRDSISCRSITVTDDPVSPTGTDVFVAVTTTGSMTSAGSALASAATHGGGRCLRGDHTRAPGA